MSAPLVVGTDGTAASVGALRVARTLELRKGWRVKALAVLEPIPLFDTGFGASLPEIRIREDRRRSLRERVEAQLESVGVEPARWSLEILEGPPARRLVSAARRHDARAVLLGLGRHGAVERFLGTETVLKVVRLAHRPVLAVPAEADDLPRRAVVAVDFSSFSLRAARAAVNYLKPPGRIHLLHVMASLDTVPRPSGDWRDAYREQVRDRLRELRRELSIPEEWSVSTSVRSGDPTDEVPAFAREVNAGLIAVGSHGHSFLGRLVLGSVSAAVVRQTPGAALVLPPEEPAPETEAAAESTKAAREWANLLDAFGERNGGRPVRVELTDPELGAQSTGDGFHLQGLSYEPHSGRIVIFLSRPGEARSHHSHGITSPRTVEVTSGRDSDAEALRIGLERGQIVLRVLDGE